MSEFSEFRLVYLPYCLQLLPDGSYVVLNRRYKPVGITRTDWVEYEDYPTRMRFKKALTAAQRERLDAKGRSDSDCIYLYNDACVPTDSAAHWAAYSERLRQLASLTIEH